jgi:type IV pilus assembly protein PilV
MKRILCKPRCQRGTSLIEVLVAIVVVAVGLLGIAKMQALAISSSRTSATRSLVAVEAASLAAAMHANETFWTGSAAPGLSVTIGASSITATPSTAVATQTVTACTSPSSCSGSAATMAGVDLTAWGAQLYQAVPTTSNAAVACLSTTPVTCTITVTWTESTVGMNAATSSGNTADTSQSYSLLVQP